VSIIFANTLFAAEFAFIEARKAVVYADKLQKAPLGYISHGKRIRGGSVPKAKGNLIAILLGSGRVGYIKLADIRLLDSSATKKLLTSKSATEHDITVLEEDED
jgi:hypothetical protein